MPESRQDTGSGRALAVLRSIRAVQDEAAKQALLADLATPARPLVVSFVNAHAVNLAWDDPGIAGKLIGSDLVLRDGIGVSLLMRLLGMSRGLNMNGTDLIPMLVDRFAGCPIALCGTAEPYLSKAAEAVRLRGGQVVLMRDGFADTSAYSAAIAASGAELVILGMGMPKQEEVAKAVAATLTKPALIVNGGAILDFWAERFPRAPEWVRNARMEWVFRLAQEPRRLWRRYLLGGVIFTYRAFRLSLAKDDT